MSSVTVCVRVRPNIAGDAAACLSVPNDESNQIDVLFPNSGSNGQSSAATFQFDHVFSRVTQREIFDKLLHSMIDDAMKGYNMTLFTYGQTGSGKTYTIQGIGRDEECGIVPRTVERLFEIAQNTLEGQQIAIHFSCLEIYQEKLRDLLVPSLNRNDKRLQNMRIRQNLDSSVWVEGLSEVRLHSIVDFDRNISSALKRRATGAHAMNAESSRSHLLNIFNVVQSRMIPSGGDDPATHSTISEVFLTSKIYLVDLAGSEMVRKTEASGTRL